MSEASFEFGISHSTLRKLDAEGKIRCFRTPGNTRLIERQSVLECLGLSASVSVSADGEQAKKLFVIVESPQESRTKIFFAKLKR
jgi:hypothetical protein